jgi:hypothetical protein
MSLGSNSGPTPPDPSQVAQAQQGYNTTTAEQNQAGSAINQNNAYGSLQYKQTGTGPGGIPLYTATTSLSPQQQQLLNTLTGTQTAAGQGGQNLIAGANYGGSDPTSTIGLGTSGISGGLMGGWLQSMQPFFTTQTQQLDTQLKNQGLSPSPTSNPNDPSTWGPYERAMAQNEKDQVSQVAGAASQFQPQAFQEASSLYTLPAQLGENLATFGGPTTPNASFVQTPQFSSNPADFTGAAYNTADLQQKNYQSQMQNQSALMSGLFGAGGNVLGGLAKAGTLGSVFSDRRLKNNIEFVATLPNGDNQYDYTFVGFPNVVVRGVMAQEILETKPYAVSKGKDGFLRVNYELL